MRNREEGGRSQQLGGMRRGYEGEGGEKKGKEFKVGKT